MVKITFYSELTALIMITIYSVKKGLEYTIK